MFVLGSFLQVFTGGQCGFKSRNCREQTLNVTTHLESSDCRSIVHEYKSEI